MAKSFKTQINPTFKATVEIPRVGGDPMPVSLTFKSMDRRSLAKLFDKWKKETNKLLEEANEADASGKDFTLEQWADREIEIQVAQVKDIVVGWGFSDEFNDENIEELVTTSVSVTEVIVNEYNAAYNRARTGN